MDPVPAESPVQDVGARNVSNGERHAPQPVGTGSRTATGGFKLRDADIERAFRDGLIRAGMRVLDLGWRTGDCSAQWASRGCEVVGVCRIRRPRCR